MIQKKKLGVIQEEIGGLNVKFNVKGIILSPTRDRGEMMAFGSEMPFKLFRRFRLRKIEFMGIVEDLNENVYQCGKVVNNKDYYQPMIIWEPPLSMDIFRIGVRVRFLVVGME